VRIRGIDSLTPGQLDRALAAGGRFVFYEYCISLIFISLRRPTDIYFLRPGEKGLVKGLRYSLVSFLLGWWGVPWGLVYTPLSLITNLSGGCDVTSQLRSELLQAGAGPSAH
jgi:hypothetical protein